MGETEGGDRRKQWGREERGGRKEGKHEREETVTKRYEGGRMPSEIVLESITIARAVAAVTQSP